MIKVKNLSKKYNELEVVKGVDLVINKGKLTSIISVQMELEKVHYLA